MLKVHINDKVFEIPKEVNIKNFLTNNIQKYNNDEIELDKVDEKIFELIVVPIICDKKFNLEKFILTYFNVKEIDHCNYFEYILDLINEIDKEFKYLCLPSLKAFDLTILNQKQLEIYDDINYFEKQLLDIILNIQKKLFNFMDYKKNYDKYEDEDEDEYELQHRYEMVLFIDDFARKEYKIFNGEKIYLSINNTLEPKYFYVSDKYRIISEIKNKLKEKINLINDIDDKNIFIELIIKDKELTDYEDLGRVKELYKSYGHIDDFHIIFLLFFGKNTLRDSVCTSDKRYFISYVI